MNAPVPPIELKALDSRHADLAEQEGKVVIVHFFATWCEPCREELAGLSAAAERLKDRPFAILAIDVGEVELRVRRFFDQQPVAFAILIDEDRAVMKSWKVASLPTSFILDASHRLRFRAAGPVDWTDPSTEALLDRLVDGNATIDGALPPLSQ